MTTPTPKIIKADEFKKSFMAASDPLTFGYPTGTNHTFAPGITGPIQFRSGGVINAIIFNNQTYGGTSGGVVSPIYQLPAAFQITEIWAGDGKISYMTLVLNGTSVKVGSKTYSEIAFYPSNLTVSLAGIRCTNFVNELSFAIVS